jgi:cold shock CspA family protein
MTTGTITTLISRRGFGFILSGEANVAEFVFHKSGVVAGNFNVLHVGQRVHFDEMSDPCESGHRRASNVRPVDGAITA